MKKFAFLLCLFIIFQFVDAQDRFDSILHSKKLDIDLRCVDFGSSKKITGYTLIIESKDSTKKYQLDSLSSKLVTTLSFGRIYTLTVSKKNFEPKSIIIDLLDGISAKEMPFLLKRTKNIYYPIAFNLIPTAYLLSSQKDLFNKLGSVGRIYYSCKNHDVDNDENFGKKIHQDLKGLMAQINQAKQNTNLINEINKIQDSLDHQGSRILEQKKQISLKDSLIEFEKISRLEIEKRRLEEKLAFEKTSREKQIELLNKEANLQKTNFQLQLRNKNIVALEQDKKIQKLREIESQTEIEKLEQTTKYNSARINLLNLEKQNKENESKLIASDLKQQKMFRNIVLLAFGIMGLLAFGIYYNLKQSKIANAIIAQQKNEVERKNSEILDSIEYAKRIQNTILPPQKIVSQYLEQSFILYLPKDIVAGDFYWMSTPVNQDSASEKSSSILFAACDCTGHGVPGAMVSVVCSNAMNKAVKEFGLFEPSKILDKVSELVVDDLSKNNAEGDEIKDGMDASLASLNIATKELQWSGANNPLWILREGEIIEVKANKQPIGKTDFKESFTNHTLQLQKGDTIYLFTDGYADQFGGPKSKKYSKNNFRELLKSIQPFNMNEQREQLYNAHMEWRGNQEQVDDICVIGVRV